MDIASRTHEEDTKGMPRVVVFCEDLEALFLTVVFIHSLIFDECRLLPMDV